MTLSAAWCFTNISCCNINVFSDTYRIYLWHELSYIIRFYSTKRWRRYKAILRRVFLALNDVIFHSGDVKESVTVLIRWKQTTSRHNVHLLFLLFNLSKITFYIYRNYWNCVRVLVYCNTNKHNDRVVVVNQNSVDLSFVRQCGHSRISPELSVLNNTAMSIITHNNVFIDVRHHKRMIAWIRKQRYNKKEGTIMKNKSDHTKSNFASIFYRSLLRKLSNKRIFSVGDRTRCRLPINNVSSVIISHLSDTP